MRINKVSYRDQLIQDYSVIIDVRTPSEFIEDHIPNSINYPVLSNKQRHEIGISYKENSFLAKKNGAELISYNISKIIKKNNRGFKNILKHFNFFGLILYFFKITAKLEIFFLLIKIKKT